MIFKKKEFFLLIFLILLQSCSGGGIGNFLESSFNDLEKTSKDRDFKKNLENKKFVEEENQEINEKNDKKRQKLDNQKSVLENKKVVEEQNQEINVKNDKKRQKLDNQKSVLENKKDTDLAKTKKQKNKKIINSSRKKKIELQSYKIIFILKEVDPKNPTEKLNTILRNSDVNFEIEMIERILDSKK